MFFKRNEGQFRETDRVTRFKLIKSGKHWLRASTSLFGLFKVIRGGVDTAQVSTEVVEERSSAPLTGIDLLKGIVAAGSVIGGGAVVQTQVHANEQTAVEKVIETDSTLVTTDKVVLGTVGQENQGSPASDIASQSISESVSVSESRSLSESMSSSVSASTSASVSASTSASTSTSTSTSASTSSSESHARSGSLSETGSTSSIVTNSTGKSVASETSKTEEVADKDGATITYRSTPANLNAAPATAGVSDKVNGNTADMLTTVATGVVTATETDKKRAEQVKKLKSLSDEIGTYLGRLGNREGAETALLKGNATIEAIQNALTDPNADLNTLISEATRTRNTVVNTVLRASSGARDYRTGQPLTRSNDLRAYDTDASLGTASYTARAKIIVTNENQAEYFATSGNANLSNGTVTLTQRAGGQAGSYTLKNKIDMTESFILTGKINLGDAYELHNNGHVGGDGIATVFSTAEPGVIGNGGKQHNGSGGSLGMGGDNLKGSFGFKLDTYHNTSRTNSIDKTSSDPGSVSGGGAFGGYIYNYNGPNRAAQGSVYPVIRSFAKLSQNPTDNSLKDYKVSYDGETKVMTVTYNGQKWTMNLQSDKIAVSSDADVPGNPNSNKIKPENTQRSLLDNAGNPEELSLALFASTGGAYNLQQFRLERFEYSAKGAYVTVRFIDADTGNEIPGKNEVRIQHPAGTIVDLSQYLNIKGYQLKATNVATARGYVSGNTVRVIEGKQGITYAFHKLKQNELYNATAKAPTIYTVQGETTSDLSAVNNFVTINPVDSSTPAVTDHSIKWLTPISTTATGNQTATALVTYSDKSTSEVTINYTVYPKVEAKTTNGVKGQFYAFKGTTGDKLSKVPGGDWANNYGRDTYLYTNVKELPEGTKWSYQYKLNNTGAEQTTDVGTPTFAEVWYTTKEVVNVEPVSHHTTYTLKAVYPNGRYGTVSSNNPSLTSETSFDYTVVDPVAKQVYVTTAGDKTSLADIIENPGNALKNSNTSVSFPAGTTFRWDQAPDDAMVANPGFYTRKVSVTLPQGSQSVAGNSATFPVIIKVNPQAPQISADQVTNTGGLPNRDITVTDALPGATVTLTINGNQLSPKTADNNGRVTFTATELADSNGLLPTGNVTVKQSKEFPNPVTNRNETLTSDVRTVAITPETEKPQVIDTVVKVKNDDNTWSDAPKTMNNGTPDYTIYSEDSL